MEGALWKIVEWALLGLVAIVFWFVRESTKDMKREIHDIRLNAESRTGAVSRLAERIASVEVRQSTMMEDVSYIRDRIDEIAANCHGCVGWDGRDRRKRKP